MLLLTDPKAVATVVGQDSPNLKRGAFRDFLTIINSNENVRCEIEKLSEHEKICRFKNGSTIEFVSYANAQDARSGKRKYLFVNEAKLQNSEKETAFSSFNDVVLQKSLRITLRGAKPKILLVLFSPSVLVLV